MKATDFLKSQHRSVEQLFAKAQKASGADERRQLLEEIESQLRTHMTIEEEIFYPAVREHASGKKIQEMVPEAYEEHHVVELILDEFPALDPDDERFQAKMTVLEELVKHHVEEEEKEMFPAAEKQLGAEILRELATEMEAAAAAESLENDIEQAELDDSDDLDDESDDDDEMADESGSEDTPRLGGSRRRSETHR